MEMTKVPAAGFEITGVPLRELTVKTMEELERTVQIARCLSRCRTLLKTMKPDAVIGTGGYASGPVLLMAQRLGIPTVVQEQNSYAGITNIRLGKKAKYICTAYENATRFFPTDRVRLTGIHVREVLTRELPHLVASTSAMGFVPSKNLLLVLGGSLGARAINRQMAKSLAVIKAQGWQVMWQCGKLYEEEYQGMTGDGTKVQAFIEDMSVAYAAADAIVAAPARGP